MYVKVMNEYDILLLSIGKGKIIMISKFTIRNFKCYGKEGATFDLSRITFVYPSSSNRKDTL